MGFASALQVSPARENSCNTRKGVNARGLPGQLHIGILPHSYLGRRASMPEPFHNAYREGCLWASPGEVCSACLSGNRRGQTCWLSSRRGLWGFTGLYIFNDVVKREM